MYTTLQAILAINPEAKATVHTPHDGSAETIDWLEGTAEISQKDIIIQAASRQKHIDQSQSLNLMIPPSTPPRAINKLLIEAWELGVKTLYYHRGTNPAQELSRNLLTCSSCEG